MMTTFILLELSTANLVHVYSIAVVQLALTQRSKGQDHVVTKIVTVAWLLSTMFQITHTYMSLCYLQPWPAWVSMSIRLPMFSSLFNVTMMAI